MTKLTAQQVNLFAAMVFLVLFFVADFIASYVKQNWLGAGLDIIVLGQFLWFYWTSWRKQVR